MGYAGKRRGLSFRGGSGVFTHRGMSLCVNSRSGGGFPLTKKKPDQGCPESGEGLEFSQELHGEFDVCAFFESFGIGFGGDDGAAGGGIALGHFDFDAGA